MPTLSADDIRVDRPLPFAAALLVGFVPAFAFAIAGEAASVIERMTRTSPFDVDGAAFVAFAALTVAGLSATLHLAARRLSQKAALAIGGALAAVALGMGLAAMSQGVARASEQVAEAEAFAADADGIVGEADIPLVPQGDGLYLSQYILANGYTVVEYGDVSADSQTIHATERRIEADPRLEPGWAAGHAVEAAFGTGLSGGIGVLIAAGATLAAARRRV